MTPSDVIAARAAGFSELKLFPAQQAGGIGMLKALAGPFPDVTFCPTGGITAETRAGVPGTAQRRLRRRLVADAEGRGRGGRLGTITALAREASQLRPRT